METSLDTSVALISGSRRPDSVSLPPPLLVITTPPQLLLASSGKKPGILLNILRCPGQPLSPPEKEKENDLVRSVSSAEAEKLRYPESQGPEGRDAGVVGTSRHHPRACSAPGALRVRSSWLEQLMGTDVRGVSGAPAWRMGSPSVAESIHPEYGGPTKRETLC